MLASDPFLLYYMVTMRRKRRNKTGPKAQEQAKRGAAAGANATRGRARRFKDRKKEENRRICRKELDHPA